MLVFVIPLSLADGAPVKPNFVFVLTDDQRWDALSVVQHEQGDRGRFPWFQTPNMDRLAAEGTRFRNAFVVNSLCAPSRTCFLTGRYSHLNGVANNHTPFPTNNVTHATLLRAAGYVTGYIGKWHMGVQRGQRPGFDYSASFIGQGHYEDCPFQINGVATPTKGWVDDVSTDFAIEFIKKNKGKPFSLTIGYKSPHGPFTPPERAKDRFANAVIRPVPNMETPAAFKKNQPVGRNRLNLNYFRCISAVYDDLGRLLATLNELSLAENTVVFFASDNGYYLGEHGLGDKRSAYDESMRIPFVVRYPKLGVHDKTVDEMVLNIDLAPTLLDFAGLPVPKEIQGRSLRPLVEGKFVSWRKAWFYEYFFEHNFPTPPILAVRTDTAKLIQYPGHDDWTELFDLKADPYEMKNLMGDPAHKKLLAQMKREFDRQAKAVQFKVPDYADQPAEPSTEKK